jgi:hypothetical protein
MWESIYQTDKDGDGSEHPQRNSIPRIFPLVEITYLWNPLGSQI